MTSVFAPGATARRRTMRSSLGFTKKILIYIPCYNCGENLKKTVQRIPNDLLREIDILVVDNCSKDNSVSQLVDFLENQQTGYSAWIVRPDENLGYAGSQKLAYHLATKHAAIEWVLMLHGDGQYPAELVPTFLGKRDKEYASVYGYRSKSHFPEEEETPFSTNFIIKALSTIESFITGYRRKEWHSGFVMYNVGFLRQLNLNNLTTTPHIDGELMFLAGALKNQALGIPIYKRYKSLTAFEGWGRIKYVFQVIGLMFLFRARKTRLLKRILEPTGKNEISNYSILYQTKK